MITKILIRDHANAVQALKSVVFNKSIGIKLDPVFSEQREKLRLRRANLSYAPTRSCVFLSNVRNFSEKAAACRTK
jgi:hypothetical protein